MEERGHLQKEEVFPPPDNNSNNKMKRGTKQAKPKAKSARPSEGHKDIEEAKIIALTTKGQQSITSLILHFLLKDSKVSPRSSCISFYIHPTWCLPPSARPTEGHNNFKEAK